MKLRYKIIIGCLMVLGIALTVNAALPDTITCSFDGMVYVCSDNTAWGTISQAEQYYAAQVPSYDRVQPDYTFITGSSTESYSGN